MKKYLFVCLALLLAAEAATAQKKLEILHTSDTHSCIMPLNPNLADTAQAGRGGYLRRVALLKEERAKNPNLLLIDSGDFSQGSPYYSLFKGDVEVSLMNMMRYDVATIGNHEFDYGLDNMARLFRMAQFPIVCANYDFTGTPVEGLVKPYIVLKRDGLKIGIFGICPQLEGLVDTGNCQGVKFLDPIASAASTTSLLKHKLHCDVVVCVSHLGWMEPGKTGDQAMVAQTRDIDIVLRGHSHSFFDTLRYVNNADGKPVGIDHNGKNAIYIGKIWLNIDKK